MAARAVVIATGARYRKLDVADYARFEGQGIHYAATAMEQQLSEGEEVVIVGGGNSAGQAAVFLSRTVQHAHILVRGAGTRCDDVRLSGAANRVVAKHHGAPVYRDHCTCRRYDLARGDVDPSQELVRVRHDASVRYS